MDDLEESQSPEKLRVFYPNDRLHKVLARKSVMSFKRFTVFGVLALLVLALVLAFLFYLLSIPETDVVALIVAALGMCLLPFCVVLLLVALAISGRSEAYFRRRDEKISVSETDVIYDFIFNVSIRDLRDGRQYGRWTLPLEEIDAIEIDSKRMELKVLANHYEARTYGESDDEPCTSQSYDWVSFGMHFDNLEELIDILANAAQENTARGDYGYKKPLNDTQEAAESR